MLRRFMKDDCGASALEYGLIAALISLAIIGGVTAVGNNIGVVFDQIASNLANANGSGS